jgi:hypothetical protein
MAVHIKRAEWEGGGTHQPLTTTSFVDPRFFGDVTVILLVGYFRAGHLPDTHFLASQDLTWEHPGSQALC